MMREYPPKCGWGVLGVSWLLGSVGAVMGLSLARLSFSSATAAMGIRNDGLTLIGVLVCGCVSVGVCFFASYRLMMHPGARGLLWFALVPVACVAGALGLLMLEKGGMASG